MDNEEIEEVYRNEINRIIRTTGSKRKRALQVAFKTTLEIVKKSDYHWMEDRKSVV